MSRIASLHRRDIIKGVVKRWDAQYAHCPPDYRIGPRDKTEPVSDIRARLRKLDLKTCSVADVDKAVGTDGWAANECGVCGKDSPITVGFESQWSESRGINVCKSCLSKAMKLAAAKPRL